MLTSPTTQPRSRPFTACVSICTSTSTSTSTYCCKRRANAAPTRHPPCNRPAQQSSSSSSSSSSRGAPASTQVKIDINPQAGVVLLAGRHVQSGRRSMPSHPPSPPTPAGCNRSGGPVCRGSESPSRMSDSLATPLGYSLMRECVRLPLLQQALRVLVRAAHGYAASTPRTASSCSRQQTTAVSRPREWLFSQMMVEAVVLRPPGCTRHARE